MVSAIKPSFAANTFLVGTVIDAGASQKKEPKITLFCFEISDSQLQNVASTDIVKPGFSSILQILRIPQAGKDASKNPKEYVLLAGVSSIFVLLHKSRSFTQIHCFENVHMGPISDLLFETFSIISVSSTEAKVVVIKANENLIKAEACAKTIALKVQEK